jgi:hypothetical protein
VSVTTFFALIDRSYLHTFTTRSTATQYCAQAFRVATTDLQKICLCEWHPSYYASVEGEMQTFIAENWWKWQAERPDWFTESVVAAIPDRFIPQAEVERMNVAAGGQRRRSSFGNIRVEEQGRGGGASVSPMVEG